MALLPILQYPDARLHRVAQPVRSVDKRIQTLVSDMLETMYHAQGIGLAATQIDVHERLIVMDLSEERNQALVLINPQITWRSESTHINQEGCLSVPGIYDKVLRYEEIHVSALNERGQEHTLQAQGMLAVCIQHEMDHLMGKVFVEYLSPLKRTRIKNKILKTQREELR